MANVSEGMGCAKVINRRGKREFKVEHLIRRQSLSDHSINTSSRVKTIYPYSLLANALYFIASLMMLSLVLNHLIKNSIFNYLTLSKLTLRHHDVMISE